MIGTLVFFVVQHPDKDFTHVAFWSAFLALLTVRAAAVVLRALLAPRRPDLRLPHLPDESARRFYRWLMGLASLTAAVHVLARLLIPAGLPEPLTIALGEILLWLLLGTLIAFVWLRRLDISALLGSPSRKRASAHYFAGKEYAFSPVVRSGRWPGGADVICALIGIGLFATISRLLTGEAQGSRILPTLALLVAWPALDGLMRYFATGRGGKNHHQSQSYVEDAPSVAIGGKLIDNEQHGVRHVRERGEPFPPACSGSSASIDDH